eukprot:3958642-Prymnesium_polylepis.1
MPRIGRETLSRGPGVQGRVRPHAQGGVRPQRRLRQPRLRRARRAGVVRPPWRPPPHRQGEGRGQAQGGAPGRLLL